jgi:hypothetical protein
MTETVEIKKTDLEILRLAKSHDDQVREMEREVTIAKGDWDEAKDASLAAKKHYDKLVNELRSYISEGPGKQMSLPGLTTAQPTEFQFAKVESWADKSIDCLEIDDKMKAKLREIGVSTLGQAVTLKLGKVSGYPNGAADIPRWKSKKAGEFEDALNAVTPEDPAGMIEDGQVAVVADETPVEGDEPSGLKLHEMTQTVRIRLNHDIEGMTEEGFVAGAEFDAIIENDSAIAGESQAMLSSDEFAIIQETAEAV